MQKVIDISQRAKSAVLARTAAAAQALSLSWRRVTTWAALAATLAVAFYVFFGHDGLYSYEVKRHESRVYAREIDRLQQENIQIKQHVDQLQNNPNAIEHQARQDLHYTRPGEVIVSLPQQQPAPQSK